MLKDTCTTRNFCLQTMPTTPGVYNSSPDICHCQLKLDVCETRMPPAATKSKYGKICKSQILTQPHPQGHVMSLRCVQPLDELTVQVWLLYDHLNLNNCTLYVSGTKLRTNGQTEDTIVHFQVPGTRPFKTLILHARLRTSHTLPLFFIMAS